MCAESRPGWLVNDFTKIRKLSDKTLVRIDKPVDKSRINRTGRSVYAVNLLLLILQLIESACQRNVTPLYTNISYPLTDAALRLYIVRMEIYLLYKRADHGP